MSRVVLIPGSVFDGNYTPKWVNFGWSSTALERLSQVESHSDTIEDFISHSSVTFEEVRDANAALLELMEVADENHAKAMRKQCKVA